MPRKAESRAQRDVGTLKFALNNAGETRVDDDRTLQEKVSAAREEERRRVARELHDDLGQRLVLLSLAAAEAMHSIPADLAPVALQLRMLHDEAVRLTHELRRIAIGYHAPVALSRGLQTALRELADDYRRRKRVPVKFRAVGVPQHINPTAAYQIYRIAQEALRNIARHAGDAPVEIRVNGGAGWLRMRIRDYGNGFDSEAQPGSSLGLTIMRERASLLCGNLQLSSVKGHGTTVLVEVPLSIHTKQKGAG
jgi:two-component system CheB/CheR fusion protein